MSVLEWKNIELFDLITLPSIRLHDLNSEITAHCSNLVKVNGITNTTLVLCDGSGYVHVFLECDKRPKPVRFKCCDSQIPIKLCALTTSNLLAIVAQKDKISLCIFIFDLNQVKKEGHSCISTANLATTSMATFIQVAVIGPDKIFALAIGLENGDVLLHVGNISRDLSLNIRRHAVSLSSINGIQFANCDQQSDMNICNLFIISLHGVYCLVLNDKGVVDAKISLDSNKNMFNQCCTISQPTSSNSFLIVGRDDAIYCFSHDCRGPCYAIKGQKELVSWTQNYLIVVVKAHIGSVLIVVDVDNKLIVLHKRISSSLCIMSANNLYYIITKGKKLNDTYTFDIYKLQENNTKNKVGSLIAQSMYDNALRMLEREGRAEYENMAYVRLEYGNNLLLRGCCTEAVTEYAETIGVIKPYHIISKLLSSRHNDNLMQYINKILNTKCSTVEHRKLLESCLDRTYLSFRMQQLWISRNDSNHICDFKQITARSINISSLIHARSDLHVTDFDNTGEDEIFNFFLEYGRELLSAHSTTVLKTVKTLIKNQKIKNILRFLAIFHEYAEFCANLLSEFIEYCSSSNEKLHYHLLTLYLDLWRDNKISTQFILDYLKKIPLRFEKILIISRANLFTIGSENLEASENSEMTTAEDKQLIECVQNHIKKNPNLAPLLTSSQRSLLMILQKVCGSSDIKILDFKSILAEKFMQNLSDVKSELQSIGDLNVELAINSSLVSRYQLNAIEFRNRCCDICRQSLHMPSVYFLCQHAFHRDCIRYNYNTRNGDESLGCVICTKNLKFCMSDSKKMYLNSKSSDIIRRISNVFASRIDRLGILTEDTNVEYYKRDVSCEMLNKNTLECMNNPFAEPYDTNFNR